MENSGTFNLPPAASTIAPEVDSLFYFIYWASVNILYYHYHRYPIFSVRISKKERPKVAINCRIYA